MGWRHPRRASAVAPAQSRWAVLRGAFRAKPLVLGHFIACCCEPLAPRILRESFLLGCSQLPGFLRYSFPLPHESDHARPSHRLLLRAARASDSSRIIPARVQSAFWIPPLFIPATARVRSRWAISSSADANRSRLGLFENHSSFGAINPYDSLYHPSSSRTTLGRGRCRLLPIPCRVRDRPDSQSQRLLAQAPTVTPASL